MTPIVLTGSESAVLQPGTYLIEVDSDRPMSRTLLARALESAGFTDVHVDEESGPEGKVRFGAISFTPHPSFASAPSAPAPAAHVSASSTVRSSISNMAAVSALSAPVVSAPKPSAPVSAAAPSFTARMPASPVLSQAPILAALAAAPQRKGMGTDRVPQGLGGGGGGSSSQPSPQPSGSPAPLNAPIDAGTAPSPLQALAAQAATAAPSDAGGGGGSSVGPSPDAGSSAGSSDGGGGGAPNEGGASAAQASPTIPDGYQQDPSSGLYFNPQTGLYFDPSSGFYLDPSTNTWSNPTTGESFQGANPPPDQGGAPHLTSATGDAGLGSDPAFAIQVGASPNDSAFRVVARLPSEVVLSNGNGVWWRRLEKLDVDPYSSTLTPALGTKVTPFRLTKAGVYEAVVYSRDRKAKARGDVWTLLEAMGFEPDSLTLLQRGMRVPPGSVGLPRGSRLTSTVSTWLATGTWRKADSVTTVEDPVLFGQLSQVA